MHSFISELNEYSVGRDYKQYKFRRALFNLKLDYLKFAKPNLVKHFHNPTDFKHLNLDENLLEDAVDVSDVYPVSVEDEKELIMKRAANLEYLQKVNHSFEYCRTRCKIADSSSRNLYYLPRENQECLTDCLNVRAERNDYKRPGGNNEKVFVWLA